jgi:hypothetical protein
MKVMRTAILLAVLASCVDSPDECGPAPSAPGWSASFNNGTASMSVADYTAIVQWREDVTVWAACMEGR